jgi:hypothetical protein
MADCSKRITDLTPTEAWQCFWQADDWRIIGGNTRRMWTDFTGTTIGQWGEIIFAFALLPAQLASFVWPLLMIGSLVTWSPPKYSDTKVHWFGVYMIISGGLLLMVNARQRDAFIFYLGIWEVVCGLSMVATSWVFGTKAKHDTA